MTTVDWIIVAVAAAAAVFGYRQGFLVGALSLAGFALGAFAGTRLAPLVLPQGAQSPYATLFGLLGALMAGAIVAGGLEAAALHLRSRLTSRGVGIIDGVLGALLTVGLALGIVWLLAAAALQAGAARDLRRTVQRSAVLQRLNEALPPSGPILSAISRFDPFPRIQGPGADVGPPPRGIARDPQIRAAAAGVVRIRGTACGLGIEGSGWVAAPGVVVTNAHVVAGQGDTTVEVGGDGDGLPARAIGFDPTNDLAVLAVDGLDRPALRLATDPRSGTPAAILGYPENGPYDTQPGRLGATRTVLSQNAYGEGRVQRSITTLRGLVRSGNSGGPMVDGSGRVVTTIFAATVDAAEKGGYGVPNAIVRAALAGARAPVSTGSCTR